MICLTQKTKKPLLTLRHRQQRVWWATVHLTEDRFKRHFGTTAYIDEKWFEQSEGSTIRVVIGDLNSEYSSTPRHIQRQRLMYLCGITSAGASFCIQCPASVTGLAFLQLTHVMLVWLRQHGITRVVLDNAPPHTHKLCKTFMASSGVLSSITDCCLLAGLAWHFLPANSPDCNPIERIFGTVTQRIRGLNQTMIWNKAVLSCIIPPIFYEVATKHAADYIKALPTVWPSVIAQEGGNHHHF